MTEVLTSSRMSKASLWSLICGLLGCLPVVPGALAVVLGVVGLWKSRLPGVTGRWMAIVGIVLGSLSLTAWTFQGKFLLTTGLMKVGLLANPRVAAHDYLAAVARGDDSAAAALSTGISERDASLFADFVRQQGAFIEASFTDSRMGGSVSFLGGTAKFATGTSQVQVRLVREGDAWKVQQMRISSAR